MDVEPDSTTVEREVCGRDFAVDDEVLCNISRGDQLYLGVVVQVNHILKKCLVRFLDDTETWCRFVDMKYFNVGENEVSCVVCKSSTPSSGNQVVVCVCGRGYHQRCHQPYIPTRDGSFRCRICSPTRRREDIISVNQCVPKQMTEKQQCPICHKKDVWHNGMLQCKRCKIWHHSTCLTTIKQKPVAGDRFFLLVCSPCNDGREYFQRLPMTWPDIVHLSLFNLNLQENTKYHDLDEEILPFLRRVWSNLQLPPELAKTSIAQLRQHVREALEGCKKRFRCGREAKKRASLWSLRVHGAPRPPATPLPVLPARIHQNHAVLAPLNNRPLQNYLINSSRKDDDLKVNGVRQVSAKRNGERIQLDVRAEAVESSTEFHGRGLVKRSVPFPLTDKSTFADARFRSSAVRKAARILRKKTKTPTKQRKKNRPSNAEDKVVRPFVKPKVAHDSSSKKEVRKRPQRNLLEARLNSTESKLYNPAKANPTPTSSAEQSPVKKKLKKSDIPLVKCKLLHNSSTDVSEGIKREEGESNSSGDEYRPKGTRENLTVKRRLSEKEVVRSVGRKRRFRRPTAPTPVPMTVRDRADLFGTVANYSLVRDLLGPLSRVEAGDNYEVAARRVLSDGQVEVLLKFTTDNSEN